MTQIPVERKRGVPAWAWLLIVLILVALLWWLFTLVNDNRRAAAADQQPVVSAPPLTDLSSIAGASDKLSLAGRKAQFTNVTVQSVVGDKTFWIGPSKDKQLFVVLNEQPSPNKTVEGQVNVNPGQTVTVTGVIKKLPSMAEARKQWQLSDANSTTLANQQIYLAADHVDIVSK